MKLRPYHWSTTLKSHLEIPRNYALTQTDHTQSIKKDLSYIYIYTCHIPALHNPPLSCFQWIHTNSLFSNHKMWNFISCQYHATLNINHLICFTCQDHTFSSFTIHESHHSYITVHHIFYHNNYIQASANHPRTRNNQTPHFPRPTPRSGWRISLRRETLAQASPLRLGEGSKRGNSNLTWDLT